jgi:hypothetical protein
MSSVNDHATAESRAKGSRARGEKIQARKAAAEERAIERMADELVASIDTLVDIRDNATASDRRQSAQYLIDRIMGRAVQRTELGGEVGIKVDLDDAAERFDRRIADRLAGSGSSGDPEGSES